MIILIIILTVLVLVLSYTSYNLLRKKWKIVRIWLNHRKLYC